MEKSSFAKGWHVPMLDITYELNALEEITNTTFLNSLSDLIIDFMDCNAKLNQLAKEYAEKIK